VPLYGSEILEASAIRNHFESIGYNCKLVPYENYDTGIRRHECELTCTFILKFTIKKSDLLKYSKGII
jgi:hypothetical protein